MTAARKPQDPAKFQRYRTRQKARGLKEIRMWVLDPDAPGAREALAREIAAINAGGRGDDVLDFLDGAAADLLGLPDEPEGKPRS